MRRDGFAQQPLALVVRGVNTTEVERGERQCWLRRNNGFAVVPFVARPPSQKVKQTRKKNNVYFSIEL